MFCFSQEKPLRWKGINTHTNTHTSTNNDKNTNTITEIATVKTRVMKTATAMIVMKVETITIGTKIVSPNQVLITIRLNPVVRIK